MTNNKHIRTDKEHREFLITLHYQITMIKDLIKTREHNKTALETVRISIQNDIDHSELMLGIGEL